MQVRCRNRTSGNTQQQQRPYRDPDFFVDPRGVVPTCASHGDVTHLPFSCDNVGFEFLERPS
jgi:hypothetical protein